MKTNVKSLYLKSALLLVIYISLLQPAIAQINKGNFIVIGSGSFSSQSSSSSYSSVSNGLSKEKQDLSIVQLNAGGGFFLIDQLAVGVKIGIDYTRQKEDLQNIYNGIQNISIDQKIITYSIGPFARYYFLPARKKINILADISCSIGSSNSGINQTGVSTRNVQFTSFQYNLQAGVAWFPEPQFSIELLGGYRIINNTGNQPNPNGFIAGIGFQFHLIKATAVGK